MIEEILVEDNPLKVIISKKIDGHLLYLGTRLIYLLPNLDELARSSRLDFRRKIIDLHPKIPETLKRYGMTISSAHVIICQAYLIEET